MEGTSGAVGLALFSRRSGICGPRDGHCASEPVRRARFGSSKTLRKPASPSRFSGELATGGVRANRVGAKLPARAIATEGAGLGLNDAGP
jgi:hypothetical protein